MNKKILISTIVVLILSGCSGVKNKEIEFIESAQNYLNDSNYEEAEKNLSLAIDILTEKDEVEVDVLVDMIEIAIELKSEDIPKLVSRLTAADPNNQLLDKINGQNYGKVKDYGRNDVLFNYSEYFKFNEEYYHIKSGSDETSVLYKLVDNKFKKEFELKSEYVNYGELLVSGNWLYYNDYDAIRRYNMIYDYEEVVNSSEFSSQIAIIDDYLYYQEDGLVRAFLDGSNQENLINILHEQVTFDNGKMYYMDNDSVFCSDINGENVQLIIELEDFYSNIEESDNINIEDLSVNNGFIYVQFVDDNSDIFKEDDSLEENIVKVVVINSSDFESTNIIYDSKHDYMHADLRLINEEVYLTNMDEVIRLTPEGNYVEADIFTNSRDLYEDASVLIYRNFNRDSNFNHSMLIKDTGEIIDLEHE